MDIPWDFGLINALKTKIKTKIFPSMPPEADLAEFPFIIFEITDVKHTSSQNIRLDINLRIVDKQQPMALVNKYLYEIRQAASSELELFHAEKQLGFAKIKIDKLVINQNATILHLTALLRLRYTEGEEHE